MDTDSTNVSAGDLFWVALTIDGSNGSDTLDMMDIMAIAVEYTAYQ